MTILETDRLVLRELEPERDAAFVNELLNSPKFLKYIGDRNVRSDEDAARFIDERYRASYRDHGYGLYAVDLKGGPAVGMCGFVKRAYLEHADIGFAFLPEHEGRGYGFESATAMMDHGRSFHGFTNVFAITSLDNEASAGLLTKLGFADDGVIEPENEKLRLFSFAY